MKPVFVTHLSSHLLHDISSLLTKFVIYAKYERVHKILPFWNAFCVFFSTTTSTVVSFFFAHTSLIRTHMSRMRFENRETLSDVCVVGWKKIGMILMMHFICGWSSIRKRKMMRFVYKIFCFVIFIIATILSGVSDISLLRIRKHI